MRYSILVLILTGLSMQYSNPEFPMIRFDLAVSIHNISGILLSLNYLVIILGNIFTTNGRYYKIKRTGLIRGTHQPGSLLSFRYFQRRKSPIPDQGERKFNPLQKISLCGSIIFPDAP